MISENINNDFFQNEVPLEERNSRPDGTIEIRSRASLTLLDEWLRKTIKVQDETIFDNINQPLKEIRKIRQEPVHKIQKDKYDRTYHDKQDELMNRVYGAIRAIRLLFASHPNAKNCEIPDWLFEGKINTY